MSGSSLESILSYALDYFPDDFDQTLSFMELPYYRYEFERKKRRLEAKRRSDGWLSDEVGYGTICHDSRGNLTDGLGNPINEVEGRVRRRKTRTKTRCSGLGKDSNKNKKTYRSGI